MTIFGAGRHHHIILFLIKALTVVTHLVGSPAGRRRISPTPNRHRRPVIFSFCYVLNGASYHTYGSRISTTKCASTGVNNGSKKSIVRLIRDVEDLVPGFSFHSAIDILRLFGYGPNMSINRNSRT
ncbi:hypothetical protein AKJ16_DCAP01508 [Drosera capensis]